MKIFIFMGQNYPRMVTTDIELAKSLFLEIWEKLDNFNINEKLSILHNDFDHVEIWENHKMIKRLKEKEDLIFFTI